MYSKYFKYTGWKISALLIIALLSIPVWILASKFFAAKSEVWNHLLYTVVPDYVYNTLTLIVGVGIIVLLIGVSTAWLVTAFDFPAKKIFSWALVLPLSLPAYIAAYSYAGMFDYTGSVSIYTSELLGIKNAYADIMSLHSLIWILGFVMYPYVYLMARASFIQQSYNVLEASRMLGNSFTRTFFTVALPLSKPALALGLSIVFMELLNDYGAMKYFGVDTFTTAICQVWFAFNDINAAVKLAVFLVIFSFVFIVIEKWIRRNKRFYGTSGKTISGTPAKLTGLNAALAFAVCFLPLLLGFIFPLLQLIIWAVQTHATLFSVGMIELMKNSFLLSITASLLAVAFALLIVYTCRISNSRFFNFLLKLLNAGYAIPGAVVAIGVLVPFIFTHNTLADSMGRDYNIETGMFIGGIIALLFAYTVRFMALAATPLEAGFERLGKSVYEAPATLGVSAFISFFKISIPLIKVSLMASTIFVFINVLKEIPLTIILRPFNFETLATKSFELAKNEQLAESSGMSLLIVLVSIVPVLILNRILFSATK